MSKVLLKPYQNEVTLILDGSIVGFFHNNGVNFIIGTSPETKSNAISELYENGYINEDLYLHLLNKSSRYLTEEELHPSPMVPKGIHVKKYSNKAVLVFKEKNIIAIYQQGALDVIDRSLSNAVSKKIYEQLQKYNYI